MTDKIFDSLDGWIYRLRFNCPGNKHDGECYYGCCFDLNHRMSSFRSLKQKYAGKKLEELRQTYGASCFTMSVVEVVTEYNITKSDMMRKLEAREGYWITSTDSVENGLNSNYGGGGRLGMTVPDDVRQKISATMKGIKRSDETKQRMRDAKQTKMVRIKAVMPNGTKVEYQSITEAAHGTGLSIAGVSKAYRRGKACRSGILFQRV